MLLILVLDGRFVEGYGPYTPDVSSSSQDTIGVKQLRVLLLPLDGLPPTFCSALRDSRRYLFIHRDEERKRGIKVWV